MLERVYIETSVVSYLKARPSRDLIIAAHQQLTHEWWDNHRSDFELCCSQLVVKEAGAGDPQAAKERLEVLEGMILLDITEDAVRLASALIQAGALPGKAQDDAFHIAISAPHGVPYILTWNCRHMANATMRPFIEAVCKDNNYVAPIICTPSELRKLKS